MQADAGSTAAAGSTVEGAPDFAAQLAAFGRLGVWTALDGMSAREAVEFAHKLEEWGYGALWLPEAIGRDPLLTFAFLAGQTQSLRFATGIANIYARDPMTMRAALETLGELAGGRFALGLGVSHAHLVSKVRGHEYGRPVTSMRNYLLAMRSALYRARPSEHAVPVILAALRRNMLRLAADEAQGAHPYLVTPEHTKRARQILGSGAWLAPEQMVLRETDPTRARDIGRQQLAVYIRLPNYQNNLLELGFEASDFEQGGSDRLVDALVAWGDEAAIRARIEEHWSAGADHVCIQPFRADGGHGPDLELLASLAPGQAS